MLDGAPAQVQIYTGDGKGKSTAAFGLAMRMAGCGGRAFVIQFRKARDCGERESAQKLGIELRLCPVGRAGEKCPGRCPLLIAAHNILQKERPDLLVLDEIMAAIRAGCLAEDDALSLIDEAGGAEMVMTGRRPPEALLRRADLVTEMKKIKHYYDKGLPARRGVEF